MYRVGFTPWDTGEIPEELTAELDSLPPGRALDIGCGTGTQAVHMAQRGWQVTGLDDLEQPLRRARDRAAAAGVTVELVKADVTRLEQAGLASGFNLAFDRGCFHGLTGEQRAAYARGVTALAAPGAVLLLMSFARNRVVAGPPGADGAEIEAAFAAGWTLASANPDRSPPPAGPLKNVPRTWYRFERV
jgi:cyclopropane fatty-acyl-phospholipid synthase-like methyltransferase